VRRGLGGGNEMVLPIPSTIWLFHNKNGSQKNDQNYASLDVSAF
jgi:hypothetical protein